MRTAIPAYEASALCSPNIPPALPAEFDAATANPIE